MKGRICYDLFLEEIEKIDLNPASKSRP